MFVQVPHSVEDHLKRWLDLLIDAFFTKSYKKTKSVAKKTPKYILPIFFHNKGLEFLNLRNQDVISAKKLQTEDPLSIVYSVSSIIHNKLFNYKDTVNNINIDDQLTYGTNLISCDCHKSSFVDTDHSHIVTGDLRIIENKHL